MVFWLANESTVGTLRLESLDWSSEYIYPAFVFATITYVIMISCNLLIVTTIVMSKSLHKPMFILMFSLPISDMMGGTAFFPHFVFSIVTQNRLISYSACITQAFFIHFYGTGNLLILSAMAYDRYLAICCPLKYNTIMTPNKLVKIIFTVWFLSFSIMFVLILMLVQRKIHRTQIIDLYCNNPSILKLSDDDASVNSYYGMAFIIFIQGGSLLVIAYTYAQILYTCIVMNQADARRKAFQTCSTHLVVFLILQFNTLITLISHRTGNLSPYLRRALGISILVFPPVLDPIVYGLNTKELKKNILTLLRRRAAVTKL